MSEIDVSPLAKILQPYVPLGRSGLLPALHAAQEQFNWLPKEVASEVAKALKVPLADVHGVIEFYSLFYNEPVGKMMIRVCTDPSCALKGADDVLDHLCSQHGIEPGQTTPDGATTVEASPCLGLCEHAPVALVGDQAETNIDIAAGTYELGNPPGMVYGFPNYLTTNCCEGPTPLEDYGDYQGLRKALSMRPDEVCAEVTASGLFGRGGAAFPTGIKWQSAAEAEGSQKYVVCNTDESEPGTFKDRALLMDDPHLMLEGMLIAAYAVGATKGYIYIRGEYPYLEAPIEKAIAEARTAGLWGENIMDTDFSFEAEIRLGAGAYICGEETALFESIEGKRGFPRIKPPFPTTHGLFSKPTVINNVETLCNVPLILRDGVDGYRRFGTEKSSGTKLFCLTGDIALPGNYEIAFGMTLRELLEHAGGIPDGKKLQAILIGGAAGVFATEEHLDVRLTYEDLRDAGLTLGSGVVMVLDETRDLRDVLKRLGKFFADESCGKCFPCQIGTQRQMEILNRIADGKIKTGDAERLGDVGWTMIDSSLCGLGQTASTAVLSAMKEFPDLFVENGK